MASATSITDVLIVGGGYAGLSAALTLYRALHTCVIFDTPRPRTRSYTSVHLLPTWEDQDPRKFREAAKAELLNTGLVSFVDVDVDRVDHRVDRLFEATDAHGRRWLGRKFVLAIGVEDVFPNLEGYEKSYTKGMSEIFPPFLVCHIKPSYVVPTVYDKY